MLDFEHTCSPAGLPGSPDFDYTFPPFGSLWTGHAGGGSVAGQQRRPALKWIRIQCLKWFQGDALGFVIKWKQIPVLHEIFAYVGSRRAPEVVYQISAPRTETRQLLKGHERKLLLRFYRQAEEYC